MKNIMISVFEFILAGSIFLYAPIKYTQIDEGITVIMIAIFIGAYTIYNIIKEAKNIVAISKQQEEEVE